MATNSTKNKPLASRTRRLLVGSLKLLISAGLIYWILRNTSIAEIATAVRSADVGLLCLAFSLTILGYFFSIPRWRTLLNATGLTVPWIFLVKSYLVGVFFNQFLPSTVGGDAFRAYASWREGAGKVHAVMVVFMDRFLGFLALLAISTVSLLFAPQITQSVPSLAPLLFAVGGIGVVAAVVVAILPVVSGSVSRFIPHFGGLGEKIRGLLSSVEAFRGKHKAILIGFGLSLLLQMNVLLQFYLLAEALGFDVAFRNFFLIIPVSLMVMSIPVSINGVGIRENVLAFFFGFYGVAKPEVIALAWLAYGFIIVHALIGGIVYALRR